MEPAMPEAAAISSMGYTTQPAAYTVDPGAYTMGTIQGAPLEGSANTNFPTSSLVHWAYEFDTYSSNCPCVAGAPQVVYSSSPYSMPGAASVSAMPMTSYTTSTPMTFSTLAVGRRLQWFLGRVL